MPRYQLHVNAVYATVSRLDALTGGRPHGARARAGNAVQARAG